MNRRQFLLTSAATLASTRLFGQEDLTEVKLPRLKNGANFKIECYNLNAWLGDSIFTNHFYRTNIGQNTASVMMLGNEKLEMLYTRGSAWQTVENEPIEAVISRSLNDLAERICSYEGCVLVGNDSLSLESHLDDKDLALNGVLKGAREDATDAFLSTGLFDKHFRYMVNSPTYSIIDGVRIHRAGWLDNCFDGYCPPGVPAFYGSVNVAFVNRKKGNFIRFVPYSDRFVDVEYVYYEHVKKWGVNTHFLHAAKKFNAEVYTGYVNDFIEQE